MAGEETGSKEEGNALGRRITKTQEAIQAHRVDMATTRNVSESAKWHMQHRPYGLPERKEDEGEMKGEEQ